MAKTVVLDARAIAALAARPAAVAAFPVLARTEADTCCGGRRQRTRPAVREISAAIAALAAEPLARLKALLGADAVVVHLADGRTVTRA